MRIARAFALLCLAWSPVALAAEPPRTASTMDAVLPQVVAWRRDFHQHPELGNRETRTAGVVAAHLRSLGLEPVTYAKTGVVALLDSGRPGPTLALRADMDALPVTEEGDLPFRSTATATFNGQTVGVMHACGHDAHTAIQLGAATVLAGMRGQWHGRVLLVFQPAEEGPPEGEEGGAELMLKEGLFERYRPDAVIGLHLLSNLNADTIGVRAGPVMAESDRFRIVVTGVQAHGSRPWSGKDPVLAAAHIVVALQSIVAREVDPTVSPAVVTVGAIHGGVRYNIIPDRVELVGTIRSFDDATREGVFASVRRIANDTAHAHGAEATAEIWRHTIVNVNDPALTARLRPALAAAAGPGKLVEVPLQTVAEDFAYFAAAVPGLYFFVGATPPGQDPRTAPSNHSPRFTVDEAALPLALDALLRSALAYLQPAAAP